MLTSRVVTKIPLIHSSYSTKIAFKLKAKAAKDYANDSTGKHPHVGTQKCTIADCNAKKCTNVCGNPTEITIDGHNTHKPPIGRMTRYIADEDANGYPNTQYFVKTNKEKVITEKEKIQYGKDFKDDPVTKTFVDKYANKYE